MGVVLIETSDVVIALPRQSVEGTWALQPETRPTPDPKSTASRDAVSDSIGVGGERAQQPHREPDLLQIRRAAAAHEKMHRNAASRISPTIIECRSPASAGELSEDVVEEPAHCRSG